MAPSSSLVCFLATLGVLLPHLALAHFLGISLRVRISEPIPSLLLLAFISLLTAIYLKPFLLDLLLPSQPEQDKKDQDENRFIISLLVGNVQWLSFVGLGYAILAKRWPCPEGVTEFSHSGTIQGWTYGSLPFALLIWMFVNVGAHQQRKDAFEAVTPVTVSTEELGGQKEESSPKEGE